METEPVKWNSSLLVKYNIWGIFLYNQGLVILIPHCTCVAMICMVTLQPITNYYCNKVENWLYITLNAIYQSAQLLLYLALSWQRYNDITARHSILAMNKWNIHWTTPIVYHTICIQEVNGCKPWISGHLSLIAGTPQYEHRINNLPRHIARWLFQTSSELKPTARPLQRALWHVFESVGGGGRIRLPKFKFSAKFLLGLHVIL